MKLKIWKTTVAGIGPYVLDDEGDEIIATVRQKEAAEIIRRAVNSHDALVGAVLMLLGSADLNMGNLDDSSIEAIENARAALEAAKGEWLCKYLTLMKSLGSSESQKTGRRFLRRTKCRLAA